MAATCQKALHKFQSFQHIWIVASSAIDSVVFPRVVGQGRGTASKGGKSDYPYDLPFFISKVCIL